MTASRIAVIGGGYSGVLQAVNLLRHSNASVTLIERGERIARGAAYGTRHADHLLNVRANRMSAFSDAPDHFADWLRRSGEGEAESFAQRQVYGRYLEDILASAAADAGERLRIVKDDAVSVERDGDAERIGLRGGESIAADAVILSVGNLPPEAPRAVRASELPDETYVADPWASDIASGLGPDHEVLLIGTGLTAIDAALMLDAARFEGRITALSRRGLVPRAHEDRPSAVPSLQERPQGRLADLLRSVRERAEVIGWPSAVDQLRPHTQALWASAGVEERGRFLRHLRPYWDVHRHRIAPEIAARIARMEEQGRLRFRAGKLVSAKAEGEGALVSWRPRGEDEVKSLAVRRIVNCTGPQGDLRRAGEPLLAGLLAAGRIRPDPCRIGIDVDERCRVIDAAGAPSNSLYAIGPMTRGALWEIVAVPDLRQQVDGLARDFGTAA